MWVKVMKRRRRAFVCLYWAHINSTWRTLSNGDTSLDVKLAADTWGARVSSLGAGVCDDHTSSFSLRSSGMSEGEAADDPGSPDGEEERGGNNYPSLLWNRA